MAQIVNFPTPRATYPNLTVDLEKVLRTTLLSVQGADFAIFPLEGLGDLFVRTWLLLSRSRLFGPHRRAVQYQEPWSPLLAQAEAAPGNAR
jgi:hypothetical protein